MSTRNNGVVDSGDLDKVEDQTASDGLPQPTPPPTLEQYAAELSAWCNERGLVPVVVARGKRSGAAVPIADFLPESHEAHIILQLRGQS